MASQPFFQARSKLARANHHMQQLQTEWQRFVKSDFCDITIESEVNPQIIAISLRPEAHGAAKGVVVKSKGLPVDIPLIIGDAIHNIRSSLDYTINEIVHWKSNRIGFPAHETRENLINSFRTKPEIIDGKTLKKGSHAAVEIAVPGIAEFICDELKPYDGGNASLWAIGRLDNTDKHRTLSVLAVPQTISNIVALDDNNNRCMLPVVHISPGGRVEALGSDMPGFKIESYGKITAEVLFAESGFVEGRPVLPTILDFLQGASETIDAIEAFALGNGWTPPAD